VGDADRAAHIVERIRDHIKKAPPRKDRFDLNEAINQVVVLAQGSITKNDISVATRLTEGLFPVQGDRVQLQQVVLNLSLNAIEAMAAEEGPRELSISTEQSQTSGVLVAVRDSGPGIDPENRERVFEAFYTTKLNSAPEAICSDSFGGVPPPSKLAVRDPHMFGAVRLSAQFGFAAKPEVRRARFADRVSARRWPQFE
jgi:hypothetical protein